MATVDGVHPPPARTDPAGSRWLTRERLLTVALAIATLVAIYLCYYVGRPFIPALTWALALAIIARPAHRWIVSAVGNENLAAGLTVVLVTVVLMLPSAFVARHLLREAQATALRFQQDGGAPDPVEKAEQIPWVAEQLTWIQEYVDVRGAVSRTAATLAESVARLLSGSAWAVLEFFIVLYVLFYLLRDRGAILREVRSWVPLSERETDEVFARVDDTIWASVYGTLMVAMLQGALGGLMFWWLGLPAPVLWGVVMAILAVVPFLGAFVVWAPAAAGLAVEGAWGKALLLTGYGVVIIGLIDNLVYPILVGQRLRLHPVPVFVAIVGGLAAFGAAGVILGPAVFAVTDAVLDVWKRRTAFGRTAEAGAAG